MRATPLSSFALALMMLTAPAAAAAGAQAQAQAKPDPKPESKPEPKAETSLAGKWNMSIETPGGQRAATLDLKLDGAKVTGSIASEIGETPIAGEYAEGKLSFSITLDMNGQSVTIVFAGAPQKDGTLSGSANMAGQDMTWTAARIKAH